jgi:heme O synthase-like polyprenyltransferase
MVPLGGLYLFDRVRDDMIDAEIQHPPVVPLFIVFATYGGWLMILLTTLLWYWSGMALVGLIYLVFIAPVVMILLSIVLYPQRRLSRYHNRLFWASALYLSFPLAVFVMRIVLRSLYGK